MDPGDNFLFLKHPKPATGGGEAANDHYSVEPFEVIQAWPVQFAFPLLWRSQKRLWPKTFPSSCLSLQHINVFLGALYGELCLLPL